MAIGFLLVPYGWWGSMNYMNKITSFKNKEIVDDCIDKKQNIIFLAPHFCSLEYLALLLFGTFQMCSMYQKHKNPYMDQLILDRRTRFGTQMYSNKDISASLIKSIKKGKPFYYLPDQDPGKNRGVFSKFYNIETATFPSLSKIAKMTNAKVIPCMAMLKRFGSGIEVIFLPPLEDYPSNKIIEDTDNMNQAIEALISYAPAQYFWSHKRFKTRPEGEKSFY